MKIVYIILGILMMPKSYAITNCNIYQALNNPPGGFMANCQRGGTTVYCHCYGNITQCGNESAWACNPYPTAQENNLNLWSRTKSTNSAMNSAAASSATKVKVTAK